MTGTPVLLERPAETTEDHEERVTHIVLEGWWELDEAGNRTGKWLGGGSPVVDAQVFGTTVLALCGERFVPGRDPQRHPLCPACKREAEEAGWAITA